MKLTIIKEDELVIKDGNDLRPIDMSGLAANFWALQWDGSSGEIEFTDAPNQTITSISDYQFMVDRFDTAWAAHLAEVEAAKPTGQEIMRLARDQKLRDSDWTQMADAPLTDAKKTEWATYRQSLRDVPSNNTSPSFDDDGALTGVTWPTEPS